MEKGNSSACQDAKTLFLLAQTPSKYYLGHAFFLKAIILSLFLTPAIKYTSGIPAVRFDDLFLLLWLCHLLGIGLLKSRVIVIWGKRQTLLVCFAIFIILSILNGTYSGAASSLGDMNKLIGIVKYILVYTLTASIISASPDPSQESEKILKFIIFCSLLMVAIVVQQYFNIFHINELYVKAVAPTQYHTLIDGYPRPRPVGMIGNPNELGFMLTISGFISFYFAFNYFKLKYLLSFFILFIALLSTLSRSAFVAAFCGLIFFLFTSSNKLNFTVNKKKIIFVCILLGVFCLVGVCFFVIEPLYEKIIWRFTQLMDISSSASWQARLEVWRESLLIFLENPVLGVGPLSRAGLILSIDNEWIYMLKSYGVLGSAYFILIFLAPSNASIYECSHPLRKLVNSLMVSSSVYMIAGFVFWNLELMSIMSIVFACGDYGQKKRTLT